MWLVVAIQSAGVALAKGSIASGNAIKKLEEFVKFT